MHLYVLDTGALLTSWIMRKPNLTFVTTQSVLDEVQNQPSKFRFQNLLSLDRLRIDTPNADAVALVREKATAIGDYGKLSEVDLELIALALTKKNLGHDVSLVSTDLAVLNTAATLDLKTLDPKGRMKDKIAWLLKCPGCGNEEPEGTLIVECPVCGTEMTRRPKRKEKIKGNQ